MKYNKYFVYIPIILVLNLGCFWQIVFICQLFFSYPTNVFIETQFDVFEMELPSLTFCAEIGNSSRGKTAEEALRTFKIEEFVEEVSYFNSGNEKQQNFNIMKHSIETMSMMYYCFTLNSYKQG